MQIPKLQSMNTPMVSIHRTYRLWACILAAGFLMLSSLPAMAGNLVLADRDPLRLIEQEFSAGQITRDEKALLQIRAIVHPDRLPARFQSLATAADQVASRGATPAILDIRHHWDELSAATQAEVTEALSRPARAFAYVSPGGFFKMHYDTLGTHAVPKTDGDFDGVPDFVERCAAYCDSSLDKQRVLGFLDPPSDGTTGGDSLFDVYFEQTIYYGYAVPEVPGPQPWPDYTSYLVLHRNFVGFAPNDDPEGDVAGAAKVTAAHEFHHCIQFAYDSNEGNWFMELDATCMEDIVFDQVNDNYNYLSEYMDYPDTSLMTNTMQYHWYASFIWDLFLVENFNVSLLPAVWNGARYTSVYTALSDSLSADFGWSQDSAFVEFTKWCFATGYRNDNLHFSEASSYPLVDLSALHTSIPVASTSSASMPAGYSATYIQFMPGTETGTLRINFDGSDSRQWAAYVIRSTAVNAHEFMAIPLTPGSYTGYVNVPQYDDCYAVTLVAVNLTEFSTPGNFTYSAVMKSPYEVSSRIVTDSGIYSGAVRQFEYLVRNPAPVGDVYRVKATDEHLWITPSAQDVFVPSHDSAIVTIPVSVPDLTPLGTTSHLVFSARSKSDSTVSDTARMTAITVLQRGDCAFDGGVDIGDLTRLIDFLFLSNSPITPDPEAGNIDCIGSIDIADLTWLLQFLFSLGPPSPCNPY